MGVFPSHSLEAPLNELAKDICIFNKPVDSSILEQRETKEPKSIFRSLEQIIFIGGEENMRDEWDYESEQRAMIAWLEGKSPDVLHYVAGLLNFDFAMNVIEWIVSQKNCDLATAALIYWKSEPTDWIEYEVGGWSDDDFELARTICERANSGFYSRSQIRYLGDVDDDETEISEFTLSQADELREAEEQRKVVSGLTIFSEKLVPPFGSRAPNIWEIVNPKDRQQLKDLLKGLGTHTSLPELQWTFKGWLRSLLR